MIAAKSAAQPASGEHELLVTFLRVLDAEEKALVRGDPEAVAALARDKAALLERFDGLAPGREPSAELRALRESARRANERNGRLIAVGLASVQQRLDVLTGRQEAGAAYDADGFARARGPAPASRSLIG